MVLEINSVANDILRDIGKRTKASRAYLFHFRGQRMTNSHEWTAEGVEGFKQRLTDISIDTFPSFVTDIKKGNVVEVPDVASIEDDSPEEFAEMKHESIKSLLMVPVKDPISLGPVGMLGLDFCGEENQELASKADPLRLASEFLMTVGSVVEMVMGKCMMPTDVFNASREYRIRRVAQLMQKLQDSKKDLSKLPSMRLFSETVGVFLSPKAPSKHIPKLLLPDLYSRVMIDRKTVIRPKEWVKPGVTQADLTEWVQRCAKEWDNIKPDITPYTPFRDVAYARYMYRSGNIHSLKFKPFFQVKPEYNVIVGSHPRPFDRIPDSIRDSKVMRSILQTLLEDVWGGELGSEVHIGVHPTRVRNFHEGEIHNKLHATLEGTHVDSTHRVAVMMIERHNVGEGGTTSLYDASCPMGLLREREADEEILKKHRILSHTLMDPLEALTFSDLEFKHDASNFTAKDPTKKAWRSLMLIMCRKPNGQKSPLDDRILDGFTPRSEAGDDDSSECNSSQ